MFLVVARSKNDNKVVISYVYVFGGSSTWTYALELFLYNEAPMLVDYKYLGVYNFNLANKVPGGGFAIARLKIT